MDTMHFLFAAYMAIWILLAVYLFSIRSREKKLREEVRRLRRCLKNRLSGKHRERSDCRKRHERLKSRFKFRIVLFAPGCPARGNPTGRIASPDPDGVILLF